MSPCEILPMTLINYKNSIIRGKNLSAFHRLGFISIIYKKSHAQTETLPSCHEVGNIKVFPKNRPISEKICHLTLILQGGIAFFAIFSTQFGFSRKTARNERKSVALPDVNQDLGFPKKSIIWSNNSMWFHEMVRGRIFPKKSHDSNSELMSIKCVGFICQILRKVDYSMFQINVY